MTTFKEFNGKPYAGIPHVRFDEGEVASATTPRRGSLLYKERAKMKKLIIMISAAALSFAVRADAPSAESGAYNDHVIAFIDTRPAAAAARIPDNPGGWIETRQCDEKMAFAAIGTIEPIGFLLIIR